MIMETLKFKVGDKVRVKSLEWYDDNKNDDGRIYGLNNEINFINAMARYCGQIFQIQEIENDYYLMHDNVFCWQDWMLENEAINEEKQEVEQLNKNDMEPKQMTKEEVFEYLNNTKILCTSTEETVKVQEKLLELGMEWLSGLQGIFEDRFLLFINGVKKLQSTADISIWVKDINRQIEPSEILAIKIKEEKPKFDPKSLRAFDKILVRELGGLWLARFFDIYEGSYYTTSGTAWTYCIPYNDETQHLHGTAEEAPEFYRGGEDF